MKKNKYGQYFTPDLIAEFMISLISSSKDSRILEPACGKGVFLDLLINNGFHNLKAYEIDSTLGSKYDFVEFNSFLSVPTTDKYSVVIGNPPYIRWKNLENELKIELEKNPLWKKYFNNLCDYLFIFILKSIEHLEKDGELIFICTEYWMNTTHSQSLRNYMCSHGYFTEIFHFKETPLFDKVTASLIIFKFIKSKIKRDTIVLYNYNKEKKSPTKEELFSRSCFDVVNIPQFKKNTRWILASNDVQQKLNQFENACTEVNRSTLFGNKMWRIGDFCEIGNGMVSGLDVAFQIKNISNLNAEERGKLINVVKAKAIDRYKFKNSTNYIFIQEAIELDDFKKKFPNFAEHFKPYLDKLQKRYSYNKSIPYWEFVFPRNQKLFEREEARIFVPCKERISNKDYFRFCYAPSGYYPTQDVTAIFKKQNCKESIEYLLAYLNNERVYEWLSLHGVVKGAIVEFSEAPIASIPFRPINWDSDVEVAIHNLITKEVNLFLLDNDKSHLDGITRYFNQLFNE